MQMLLQSHSAGTPGTTLETLNLNVTTKFGTNNAPTVVAASGSTFLDSSMDYWMTAFSPTNVFVNWNFNSTGSVGTRANSLTGPNGPWIVVGSDTLGAFRVEVANAVPEPSTLGLFGLGLLGLGAMKRRRLYS